MTDAVHVTDRTSWLAFRADWRVRYRTASDAIRAAKAELRSAHADERGSSKDRERRRHAERASDLQGDLHPLRRAANALMVELDEAKELKAERMAEARQALAA